MDKLDSLVVLPVLFRYGLIKKIIQLTPVVLKDIYLFERLSRTVIDVVSCEDKKVLKKYRNYIDHFNSIGSGLPINKVSSLSIKNAIRLVNKIFDVNSDLFKQTSNKSEQPKQLSSWFDIVQKLISNGHQWSEVQEYNYSQIMGFIESIENQVNNDRRSDLILMRSSQSDEKGFNSVLKSLTKTKTEKTASQSQPRRPILRK